MSDDLYPVRVRWDGRKGVAKYDGVVVALKKPPFRWVPSLAGMTEMDFAPSVQVGQVRIGFERTRHLEQSEVELIEMTLVQMAAEAHDALEGGSTLAVVFERRA